MLVFLILEFVVQPVSTLLHELGHAVAVVRLGGRQAQVIVGRGPWAKLRLGRVHVMFSLLPARGVLFRGICRYDPAGLPWRSIGWIALAGPLATLVELALLLAVTPALWNAGPLARGVTVFAAAGLLASLVVNLIPQALGSDGPGALVQRDGFSARQAFARHRHGRAPQLQPARLPGPALPAVDVSRSVPPPTRRPTSQ